MATNIWLTTVLIAGFSLIATELKTVAQPLESKLIDFNSNSLSYSASDLNLSKTTKPSPTIGTSFIEQPIEFNGENLQLDRLINRKNLQFSSSVLFVSSSTIPQLVIADKFHSSLIAQVPEESVEELEQSPSQNKPETANTGQDPTQPITRFDVRLKYQNLSDLDLPGFDEDLRNWILTLRADRPIPLGESGWVVGSRIDVPLIINPSC